MPKSSLPDTARPDPDRRSDLIQGTLDMLILKAVTRGRMHGYAIAEWIHSVSEETLQVEEGALYPALHRLELKGMLDSEWGTSGTNRRVKFYNLTPAGRKHLAAEREQWRRLTAGMLRVLEAS
jgi:PadR family transcriptional regulator PadR